MCLVRLYMHTHHTQTHIQTYIHVRAVLEGADGGAAVRVEEDGGFPKECPGAHRGRDDERVGGALFGGRISFCAFIEFHDARGGMVDAGIHTGARHCACPKHPSTHMHPPTFLRTISALPSPRT